ncbi:MAG: hypothetical protein L0G99_04405 [Propionibacteriales bacterium]|nr:hypothetical protein [Propionibacteriales bacterium]
MKIVTNRKALGQILNSPGLIRDLQRRTEAIKAAAGEGFDGNVVRGKRRPRGGVVTATAKAMRRNAKENTLVKAMDAGRR